MWGQSSRQGVTLKFGCSKSIQRSYRLHGPACCWLLVYHIVLTHLINQLLCWWLVLCAMSARCGEFLKDCHWASLWEGPCSCVTDNLKLSYSYLFSWKMNITETEAILGCTYTPCHYLPAALFCLRSHVIYLFVKPTPCMFLLSLCRLHGCSHWWQIPAIFCSLQVPVVSSYVTAADLLRIYRLNAIYFLTWPQQTHVKQLCFWIGREWLVDVIPGWCQADTVTHWCTSHQSVHMKWKLS